MNKIVQTEAEIRALLPNVLKSVQGETPLLEKLSGFLDSAQDWVESAFNAVSFFFLSDPEQYEPGCIPFFEKGEELSRRLVVCEALLTAVPKLDLVLTPNGFGIVSNQNISPASKERTASLLQSLRMDRDRLIGRLLSTCISMNRRGAKWYDSEAGRWFAQTLFPGLNVCVMLGVPEGERWEKYLALRPRIMQIEASIADGWLSPELMSEMRHDLVYGALRVGRSELVGRLRAMIVDVLQGNPLNKRALADMVDYIRKRPSLFPLWHNSDTAALFSPPVFRNEKKASGYFF